MQKSDKELELEKMKEKNLLKKEALETSKTLTQDTYKEYLEEMLRVAKYLKDMAFGLELTNIEYSDFIYLLNQTATAIEGHYHVILHANFDDLKEKMIDILSNKNKNNADVIEITKNK